MYKFRLNLEEYLKIKALCNAARKDGGSLAESLTTTNMIYYRGKTDGAFIACNGHILRIETFEKKKGEFPNENLLLPQIMFSDSKAQVLEKFGKKHPEIILEGGFKEWNPEDNKNDGSEVEASKWQYFPVGDLIKNAMAGCGQLKMFGFGSGQMKTLLKTFVDDVKLAFRFGKTDLNTISIYILDNDGKKPKFCGLLSPVRITELEKQKMLEDGNKHE